MDAAVDIRPTYSAMAFTAAAAPIRCTVGQHGPFGLMWNQTVRVPVPAGDVVVVIWSAWVTKRFMGTSHAQLHLPAGHLVGLQWKMPQTVWGTGKLEVVDTGRPSALAGLVQAEVPPDAGAQAVGAGHPTWSLDAVPLDERAAVAPPGAAWHPDPTGRHPHRWWDGARWTDAVSDGVTTSSDPLPPT